MRRLVYFALFGILFAPTVARAQTEEVVYYHTDAIGSVRMVTNPSGVVLGRYDYFPFGQQWEVPATNPDVRQFAGKEFDDTFGDTGLNYFGARYYSGQLGRFTSVDPVVNAEAALTDPQRWNRYSYSVNRPLAMIDPDGREAGYLYRPNGQMVAPIQGMTPTMAKLWGGTVAVGAGALVAVGGLAATEAAAMAMLVRHPTAVFAAMKILANVSGISDSRIVIPGPRNAPLGKLDYLLGQVASAESAGKGKFFGQAMGYTAETLDTALRTHLAGNISNAVRNDRGFFEVVGSMTGPSGITAPVKSVWQVVNGKFELITAHPYF